jgi:hypothetical protein
LYRLLVGVAMVEKWVVESQGKEEEEMRWKEAQGGNRVESPSSSSFARTALSVKDLIGRRDLVTSIER